ncbi:MAG: hypothetical protein AAFU64_17275, partial [Bacteroidota bacterium]
RREAITRPRVAFKASGEAPRSTSLMDANYYEPEFEPILLESSIFVQMDTSQIYFRKYQASEAENWDNFLQECKNFHFFFHRAYIEYHTDRFEDHSLMVYYRDKLIALLPAHRQAHTLCSHQGLSYGGFLSNHKMNISLMLRIFQKMKEEARHWGFEELLYKPVPYFHHKIAAQEDMYALRYFRGQIVQDHLYSICHLDQSPYYSRGKKGRINKSQKAGVEITISQDYAAYWQLLETLLEDRYQTQATHRLDEITYLAQKFPNHIKLFIAHRKGQLLGGSLVFENPSVVQAQYIASNEQGKALGALALLFKELTSHYQSSKKYLSLGHSRENNELGFNPSLVQFKESLGAGTYVQSTYQLKF